MEVYVVQHLVALAVAEVNVIERHFALDLRQGHGPRRILNLRQFIEQLEDAVGSRAGLLEDVVDIGQAAHGLVERDDVREERDECAKRELALHDHPCACAQHQHAAQRRQEAQPREKAGPGADGGDALGHVRAADVAEARQLRLFLAERLDDTDAGEVVLQARVDVAQPVAHPAVDGPRPAVEVTEADGDERHGQQRDQCQPPFERQQHDRRTDQPDGRDRGEDGPVRDELLQRVDIVADARHQLAGRGALEEGQRQPLQVVVDAYAQVVEEPLPDGVPQVLIAELRDRRQGIHDDHPDNQRQQTVELPRADHIVDDGALKERREQTDARVEQDDDAGDDQGQRIGTQVVDEPFECRHCTAS